MSTFSDVVSALNEMGSPVEAGLRFEHLMVRYFQLDPLMSSEYDEVYHWSKWPYNGGRTDSGIDIVARNRDDHTWTAIQCKFYAPSSYLQKGDLDSFFTESGKSFTTERGKETFTNRIIVSTTDRWSSKAEEAVEDQTIPVQVIGTGAISDSSIKWDVAWPGSEFTVNMDLKPKFEPHPHQRLAIDKVFTGFETHDRGKLIMACGTGKTFTALKLAEELAEKQGGRARILFAVPSISLLGQSMREWSANSTMDIRPFAVCSDAKVSRAAEDIKAHELEIPVTTDGEYLAEQLSKGGKRAKGLQVVFTTYQSLQAVHEAQQRGASAFDLVICDEAHRTTGITLAGEEPSAFTRIHDADYVQSARRLYMTATPRLYDDKVKDKADDHSAEIASMDDEAVFGPEFHRLGFGEAVEKGLLTDYKVLVIGVDEEVAAQTVQKSAANSNGEITLDTTSKLIGCWTALAKRSGREQGGFSKTDKPMQRAVAFAKDIKTSRNIAEITPTIIEMYTDSLRSKAVFGETDEQNLDLELGTHHVDGTMNALKRNEELSWLKAHVPENECRVLTNVRCLSEGVDVPALDAVLFLNPRNSIVDVVQSVGRVMRKTEDKDYGYIILPVAIPAGVSPSAALSDNKRFRVVWEVLNALRAHDDRFNAIVNSAVLNQADTKDPGDDALSDKIQVDMVSSGDGELTDEERNQAATQMALFSLEEWQEAMYTKIVDKVGDREYWEDWADDVADIAAAQITRITSLIDAADPTVAAEFERFVEGLRGNLNDSITEAEAISMLSQHLITAPVFDALFAEHDFASHNPVSRVMQRMVDALGDSQLDAETEKLEKFYASVRVRASEVSSAAGKQTVIKDLYERFFKKAFRRQSEALGIVYTPVEIVDFILRAADEVSRTHFGRGLTDEGVHVLDPFTGTGTFMVRLLQSGLIEPHDLARKYAAELHATEIMLLAYYVAAVNIETTYHGLLHEKALREGEQAPDYEPFGGIVLADTFQVYEDGDQLDLEVFEQNNARITRQKTTPIHVIVGNPPYSVGQTSANDLNANLKYPTLDTRIEQTYAAKSTATNKNSLYDSYLRAFRWATDRVEEGVVAFVSNGGWIDANTGDGVRLSLAEDYSELYVFNLRGNSRTAGDLAKREGGNVFNVRVGIQIFVGVKKKDSIGCRIFYRDVGDYLTTAEKLEIIDTSTIASTLWEEITPNNHGDWINQRSDNFGIWPVLGDKKNPTATAIFRNFSAGLKTARDAWCYGQTTAQVTDNIETLLSTYEAARKRFHDWSRTTGVQSPKEADVNRFLQDNPDLADTTTISWNRSLKNLLARDKDIEFKASSLTRSLYRPFTPMRAYFNRELNDMIYQLPSMFPTPNHDNIGFYVLGVGATQDFALLSSTHLPDIQMIGAGQNGQFFPRWTWEPVAAPEGELDFGGGTAASISAPGAEGEVLDGYRRVDNITDEILGLYRDALGADVSKDDIFYFVYGQLHDPGYREAYAADLKKMLPHIETPTDRARFDQLAAAGRELMDLHTGYEDVEPFPVTVDVKPSADPQDRETWRVTKLKWAKKKDPETGKNVDDHTTMIYNPKVTIRDIPADANAYMLGARSALAWIIDRYQVKKDKASGIVNDPNDWADEVGNPRYIVDLIAKVTRVAVETVRIVDSLNED
ncbi:DEAD/DEAH box helicase [Corynebacterium hylobatis]|uniref:DEAD/DEAH box helicase n=1 Tax=Corynebacterium hylobatis TaxID=1859290 RepID=A0A3S0BI94_9CORY|nr:DEAD/DEAH box helicase [Corynebacterium hylobatis]RSZ66017.1 DEAD/DEAH box helicase [Corynebacterium hylobatis]